MCDQVVSFLQDVLFISILKWIIMMENIRHTVFVPMIRYNTYVVVEDNDISALPRFDVREVSGQTDCIVLKPDLQVLHPAEINILIGALDIVFVRMYFDISLMTHGYSSDVTDMSRYISHCSSTSTAMWSSI